MNYLEYSLENIEEETKKLYKKIEEEGYDYDIVIFIAKGSYPIGNKLAKLKGVPLLEIVAKRKGGRLKKIVKPILKFIPKSMLIKLRKKEMESDYHEKNNERKVSINEIQFNKYVGRKKVLLVDDSIDSGYTIIETKEKIQEKYKDAEIKIAVLNTMSKSITNPDFTLYRNTMICGPWSNDSKYFKNFIKQYNEWKKEYERKD